MLELKRGTAALYCKFRFYETKRTLLDLTSSSSCNVRLLVSNASALRTGQS